MTLERSPRKRLREFAVQVTSPYFCAGVVIREGVVVKAAPIIKRYKGYTFPRLVRDAAARGWRCQPIQPGGSHERNAADL